MDADGHDDRSWVLPAETDLQRHREARIRDGSDLDTAQTLLKLGGFPEKRHYDDEEAETDPPSSNLSTDSGSPAPLVPEVERRLVDVRKGDGSELDTAQILKAGGVPEKRHYNDQGETNPPSSNFSTVSVSPPLLPVAEQRRREKRDRYRSKLGKAKTFQTVDATTSVDPRSNATPPVHVSAQQSPQAASPVLSTNKDEMHNIINKTSQEELAAGAKRGTKRGDEDDPSPCSETTAQSEVVVGMGFFSKLQENSLYGQVLGSTGVKKKRPAKRKDEDYSTSPRSETTAQAQEEVGLGFFSKLQENGLYGQVVGSTGAKKKRKKAAKRRNKPKPDPLEGVSMGFFSGTISDGPKEEGGEKKEISDRIKPLYNWAPVPGDKFQAIYEFTSPVLLPWLAIKGNFKGFAWVYCMVTPIFHTLETLLTNFGPDASKVHLPYAPLTPMMHICIDLTLNLPIAALCFLRPELFGKHSYLFGYITLGMLFQYWAWSYKKIVLRRKAQAKQLKAQ